MEPQHEVPDPDVEGQAPGLEKYERSVWHGTAVLALGEDILDEFQTALTLPFCCPACALRWVARRVAVVLRMEADGWLPPMDPSEFERPDELTPLEAAGYGFTGDDGSSIAAPLRRMDRWAEGVAPHP